MITIGETTGVVKAIRMRATTITDWDRKELVVPNKEFATGRLLNWTLTNKTNRRVIEVGVEYGTDPDLVRDLLLKVAQESPRVLETPKPIALFEKFADSALVFTLRVYHPKISDRLARVARVEHGHPTRTQSGRHQICVSAARSPPPHFRATDFLVRFAGGERFGRGRSEYATVISTRAPSKQHLDGRNGPP